MDEDEEYYTVPLTDQAVFGAGLKRKRVPFIPASTSYAGTPQCPSPTVASSKYLSVVLPNAASALSPSTGSAEINPPIPQVRICEVCSLPLPTLREREIPGDDEAAPVRSSILHAATLVHQVCLAHSYPPSHLDRTRKGLKYLSSYGWDPDERLGLGRKGGEGRLAPVKAKEKNDTLGLGAKLRKSSGTSEAKKVKTLDAKAMRKKVLDDKKREEKLRRMMWGREDVERYLGHD